MTKWQDHYRTNHRPSLRQKWFVYVVVAVTVICAALIFVMPAPVAHANSSHGTLLVAGSAWNGVDVRSNGNSFISPGPRGEFGYQYQCVELVQRFYYQKGWTTVKLWGADGWQMYDRAPGDIQRKANDGSYRPVWGDVIVFNTNAAWTAGHVAIVTAVSNGRIDFVEQNVGSQPNQNATGRGSLSMNGNVILTTSGRSSIRGILHSPKNGGPGGNPVTPTPVTPTPQNPAKPSNPNPADGTVFASTVTSVTLAVQGSAQEFQIELWKPNGSIVRKGKSASKSFQVTGLTPGQYTWKAEAYNGALYSGWSEWRFTIQTPQPAPGKPHSPNPGNGAVLAYTTSVNLSVQGDAQLFQIELWKPDGSIIRKGKSSSKTFTVNGLAAGQYTWKAEAYNGDLYSGWSEWRFTIQPQPQPPAKPSGPTPANGAVLAYTTSVTMTVQGTADEFQIELWKPDGSIVRKGRSASRSFTANGLAPGQYTWKAEAYNQAGWSGWSEWRFTIQPPPQPPAKPGSPSPANGASLAYATSVTLSVQGTADQFEIELWKPDGTIVRKGKNANRSFTVNGLAPGQYTWKAEAYNQAGWSGWAEWRFTIQPQPQPPAKPSGPSPADGATLAYTTSVTLTVQGSAPEYQIELWKPDGTIVRKGKGAAKSFTVNGLVPGQYLWKAEAYNPAGWSGWSEWRFTIQPQPQPPIKPSGPNPVNGAVLAYTTSVTLSVQGTADQFEIELWKPDGTIVRKGKNATKSFTATGLAPGQYLWKAEAYNQAGWSGWSEWRFTIQPQPQPLTKPHSPSPADGATLVDVTSVTLSVQGNAQEYQIEFWKPDGTIVRKGKGASRTFTVNNLTPGTYRWQAEAYNGTDYSGWSTWTFTIEAAPEPLTKPVNPNPEDGAVFEDTTELTLSIEGNGAQYEIEVWQPDGSVIRKGKNASTSLTVSELVPGEYHWQAEAYRGTDYSGWSTWTFTIRPDEPTATATRTRTPTRTPTITRTPTKAATATKTPTRTATAKRTPTKTATAKRTPTKTATAKKAPTKTATAKPAATRTRTPTPRPTRTTTAVVAAAEQGDSEPTVTETGALQVESEDSSGAVLVDACFAIERGDQEIARVCDGDDGQSDGATRFHDLELGTYQLIEVRPPDGYQVVKDKRVTIRADRVRRVTVKHRSEVAVVSGGIDDRERDWFPLVTLISGLLAAIGCFSLAMIGHARLRALRRATARVRVHSSTGD